MDTLATEKQYPIKPVWIIKIIIITALTLLVILPLSTFGLDSTTIFLIAAGVIGIFILNTVINGLNMANLHYSFDNQAVTISQGIFAKKEKVIPYSDIHDLNINQGFFDKLFGIANLSFAFKNNETPFYNGSVKILIIGFHGTQANISGLSRKDAEALKVIISQRQNNV